MFGPSMGLNASTTPAASNHLVDAPTEGVAFVFDARSTNAITHLGFRYGARAVTPPEYIVGLEGVSTSTGFPDGTYKTNGGNCSGTFTPPADTSWDGTWQWVALANTYTPSLSERLAFTIRASGTPDGTNNSSFTTNIGNIGSILASVPYAARNTSGSWAMQTTQPIFGVRTASSRYGFIYQGNYTTRSASTVGHRQAMKISLPAGFGSTVRVIGFRASASIANAAGKAPLAKIWSASSALASKTLDSDQVASAAANAFRIVETYFDTAVDLSFGTDYYIGLEVADATNGGVLIYGTQYAASDDKATDESGAYCNLATYNGSAWTDDNTVRPWMELIVDDWTEPSGGGAIIVNSRRNTLIGR
jgi:hypothetical protein